METLIVICLIIVIILLLKDKVIINKTVRMEDKQEKPSPELPDIMGHPRAAQRQALPKRATKSQSGEDDGIADNFGTETYGIGVGLENPQIEGEPDEVLGNMSGFENEEDEWDEYGFEDSDNEFATGVTFDDLMTVGAWLEQDTLEPAQQQKAVDIVQRLQGTELFGLLENSIGGASQRVAELLDRSLSTGTDFSSPDLRKSDSEDFDIGEFV